MKPTKRKILYVDDEKINLELFRITFQDVFDVKTALSAALGLEILQNESVDVIISDLKMPEVNGIEFIERIKTKSPEKVCILLTAYIEPEAMLKAINQELVFRYVTKPWNRDDLLTLIDLAFEKHQASQPQA